MRTLIVAAVTAAVGLSVGRLLRGSEPKNNKVQILRDRGPEPIVAIKPPVEKNFPNLPKPPVEIPKPTSEESTLSGGTPIPTIVGDIPVLPSTGLGGSSFPLTPLPTPTEAAMPDLNADEARVKGIVLRAGGAIVSSSDAGDEAGKIGRSIVAEISSSDHSRLMSSIRKEMGNRVIISDGGAVSGSSPELKKAETDLESLRKELVQARIDFLPQAPALRQLEEDFRNRQSAFADLRKSVGRHRINILLRHAL